MNKCCICSAVKNVDMFIPKLVTNMRTIGSVFDDYRIVFFYDTSSDGTINLLRDQARICDKIEIVCNPEPLLDVPKTHHLAHARNGLLDVIRNKYSDYEYFIMMDADEVCTAPVKMDIFNKNLARKDWDALSFNKAFYYDLWALSMKHLPFSVWHFQQPNGYQIYIDAINHLLTSCPGGELIPVFSAFNGFCIYRTKKFIDCNYDGRARQDLIPEYLLNKNIQTAGKILPFHWAPQEMSQDCEHRSFHFYATFNNGAEICISPEIIFPDDPDFKY